MTADPRLNDIIKKLQEKINALRALSDEMRAKTKKRSVDEIQADLNAVLNEMSALHERANTIIHAKL